MTDGWRRGDGGEPAPTTVEIERVRMLFRFCEGRQLDLGWLTMDDVDADEWDAAEDATDALARDHGSEMADED